jgi:hypothetical protein
MSCVDDMAELEVWEHTHTNTHTLTQTHTHTHTHTHAHTHTHTQQQRRSMGVGMTSLLRQTPDSQCGRGSKTGRSCDRSVKEETCEERSQEGSGAREVIGGGTRGTTVNPPPYVRCVCVCVHVGT